MQHLDEGTIHAWLDGALDAPERERVDRHLASCAECEALVAEARGFIAGASRILGALDEVPGGVVPRRPALPPTRADLAAAARPESVVTPLAGRRPRSWVTANAFRIAAAITVVAAGALAGRYGLYGDRASSARTDARMGSAPALETVATSGAAVTTTTDTAPVAIAETRQALAADVAARSDRQRPAPAPAPRTVGPPREERAAVGRVAGDLASGAATNSAAPATGDGFTAKTAAPTAEGQIGAAAAAIAPPAAPPPAANPAVADNALTRQRADEPTVAAERRTLAAGQGGTGAASRERAAAAAAPRLSRLQQADSPRVRELAGCWRFVAPSLDADRAEGSRPVLLSPLRLDTTVVASGLGAGAYDVRTVRETRPDFVPYRYLHWRPLDDDRIEIILSSGFGGMRIELSGRGERLRGTGQTFTDVRGIGERTFDVEAVRARCDGQRP